MVVIDNGGGGGGGGAWRGEEQEEGTLQHRALFAFAKADESTSCISAL